MSGIGITLLVTVLTLVMAVTARTELRERRIVKMEREVYYIRRDLDQVLGMFRLTPISEQEKRKR
jgi:hypothetical protein